MKKGKIALEVSIYLLLIVAIANIVAVRMNEIDNGSIKVVSQSQMDR